MRRELGHRQGPALRPERPAVLRIAHRAQLTAARPVAEANSSAAFSKRMETSLLPR
ncbi:hypothetical protein PSCLAVI8L_50084 [Pseudoclavibacter sp. 8L]|nr:hypothetical protein PSCLAVI8L_50084 [Pseudoclavibacter sp. 8L]